MLAILIPLLLAAATGLAYLAVTHPAVYKTLHGKLYLGSALVFAALVIWSTSFSWAHTTLIPFIQHEKQAAAKASIEEITISVYWLLLWQFVAVAYLHFLSWLANQIQQDRSSESSESEG